MSKPFTTLQGQTFSAATQETHDGHDAIRLTLADGSGYYQLYHVQECYESVWLEDICGDLEDLVGSPVLFAEETALDLTDSECKTVWDANPDIDQNDDRASWSFYKISTIAGGVTIRFCGTSNGCYAENAYLVFTWTPSEAI